MHPQKKKIIKIYGGDPCSLDELAHCVIAVIHKKAPVLGFSWNMRHGNASNSHSCPLDGVLNFSRTKDKPTDYPGWSGRVWIRYGSPPVNSSHFGSAPFYDTLTYTGTGGWGGYNGPWESVYNAYYHLKRKNAAGSFSEPQLYSWDYRFYDSDWPNIQLFEILSTGGVPREHNFSWTDPNVQLEDDAIIKARRNLK